MDALRRQHLRYFLHLQTHHITDLLLRERGEGDDLVDTVQELRTHRASQLFFRRIRGHDDDRVLEVGGSSLVVRQTTIVQYLQENVEHIGMCFLDLIEEYDGVGLTAHSLSQLSTFIIAHIARRGTNQTGDTVFLLIFRHIDTRHHRFVVEQVVCQGLGEFGLTDTRRTQEDERGNRALRILQAGTTSAHGVRDGCDGFVLTDHTLVQFCFEVQQFLAFTLHHLRDRDARPATYHLCDVVCRHFLTHE